jgi:hypothetical protein
MHSSDASRREIAESHHAVIASEAKQSMAQQKRKSGLLRFARNDGYGCLKIESRIRVSPNSMAAFFVMPGLVPGIHVLGSRGQEERGWPGRSPAMTKERWVIWLTSRSNETKNLGVVAAGSLKFEAY